ncbi:hypothetical protein RRG08_009781 [Elysia crispata]|uniref:Uncharacterized protein n=1 Tax=Elysia crispata TaxID=231223 RepID=A0AAE1DK95_9GAST|nr:hypothetical protein RRG08_009781 [Elysia crispata]
MRNNRGRGHELDTFIHSPDLRLNTCGSALSDEDRQLSLESHTIYPLVASTLGPGRSTPVNTILCPWKSGPLKHCIFSPYLSKSVPLEACPAILGESPVSVDGDIPTFHCRLRFGNSVHQELFLGSGPGREVAYSLV